MKNAYSSPFRRWSQRIGHGLLLLGSCLVGHAQFVPTPNYIADQFDTDTTGYYSNQGWGATPVTLTWLTNNVTPIAGAPNNAGSGSMEWQSIWVQSGDQIMVDRSFNNINPVGDLINFALYTNISFDILFLPDSATNSAGNFATLQIECIPSGDGWPSTGVGGVTLASTNVNQWIHVSLPLPQVAKTIAPYGCTGFGIKIQESASGQSLGQTNDFLIDNVILGGDSVPPPAPVFTSIAPLKAPPGLVMVAPGGGNEYNRTMIEAEDPTYGLNFSWIGASVPVSYSFTLASFPDTNHPGFQSHVFFVPNGGAQDPGIDYDAANVAEFVVQLQSATAATAFFTWKTNQSEGNDQYGQHTVATITNLTGALGTWTVVFNNDTNVTIVGPSGVSASGYFPSETVAQVFGNPLSLYFGNQEGGTTANIGQYTVYSQFTTTNTPITDPISDVFTNDNGIIDTTHWFTDANSGSENNVFILQPGAGYWVTFTGIDTGYVPYISPALGSTASWTVAGGTNFIHTTLGDSVILSTNLPAGKGFIRLQQP